MVLTLIVFLLTVIMLIVSILFFPKIKIGKCNIDSFWIVSMLGAFALIAFQKIDFSEISLRLFANTSINPVKILVLFICMSFLSIYLDELGFFKYMANLAQKGAKNSQKSIFIYLYIITSILTIFTSNDIIILTFTPFICQFAKQAKINPIPYLILEFVAANSWSIILVIGNPTNIYLATMFNITFFEYLKVMILPGMVAGLSSFIIIYLLFKKELRKPMVKKDMHIKIKDKFVVIIGLVHLLLCTALLAIANYIHLKMWLITFAFAISLIINVLIYSLIKKRKQTVLSKTIKRLPWNIIPFILSMFVIVATLEKYDITKKISDILGEDNVIAKYGISSFLFSNVINNIPMSVTFSSILQYLQGASLIKGVYATIISSNIGAYFTPLGSLAGIMWINILKKEQVEMNFLTFIKNNIFISLGSLTLSLLTLYFVLL